MNFSTDLWVNFFIMKNNYDIIICRFQGRMKEIKDLIKIMNMKLIMAKE